MRSRRRCHTNAGKFLAMQADYRAGRLTREGEERYESYLLRASQALEGQGRRPCVASWLFLMVSVSCFVSMVVALLAGIGLACRLSALKARYWQLQDDYIELQAAQIPAWVNEGRKER